MPITSLLFVCIENAGRSQMAEAFAKFYGSEDLKVYSAGSKPSGTINPQAIDVMRQTGYDLTSHQSKSLSDIPDMEFDAVVTMGCGDECPFIRARQQIEWDIPDPKERSIEDVRRIRDLIRDRVQELLKSSN